MTHENNFLPNKVLHKLLMCAIEEIITILLMGGLGLEKWWVYVGGVGREVKKSHLITQ